MKMSIRTRLFITFNLLIAFFVFVSWLLNYNYLEKYYISQNKKQLLTMTDEIDHKYNGDPANLSLELETIELTKGLNVLILDQTFAAKYRSRGLERYVRQRSNAVDTNPQEMTHLNKSDPRIHLVVNHLSRLQAGETLFKINHDPGVNMDFLNLLTMLHNGDYLLMSTPLPSLRESALIANRFFLFTGLLTILIGSIVSYIFSKRFTRPILELNAIAQKMSELDFTAKYHSNHRDELGELGESINSLSDQLDRSISDLKQANEKLLQDIEHERKIDEMRKEFVSNVSHELKTPIALIQGYAEGLKVNVVEDEESKIFYCDVITDEASKMNKIVRELLDLSQIESGYSNLEKQSFDISSLIQQVVSKYDLLLKEKGITLSMVRKENVLVNGDLLRVEQVLVNYINNAINHMEDPRALKLTTELLDGSVRISVFNTGKPIPEESLDKIFTSFYKVDKARTRAYGGTGLGLSIVKAIMDLHQNAYGVKNMADGVEFWFELDRDDTASI